MSSLTLKVSPERRTGSSGEATAARHRRLLSLFVKKDSVKVTSPELKKGNSSGVLNGSLSQHLPTPLPRALLGEVTLVEHFPESPRVPLVDQVVVEESLHLPAKGLPSSDCSPIDVSRPAPASPYRSGNEITLLSKPSEVDTYSLWRELLVHSGPEMLRYLRRTRCPKLPDAAHQTPFGSGQRNDF